MHWELHMARWGGGGNVRILFGSCRVLQFWRLLEKFTYVFRY